MQKYLEKEFVALRRTVFCFCFMMLMALEDTSDQKLPQRIGVESVPLKDVLVVVVVIVVVVAMLS